MLWPAEITRGFIIRLIFFLQSVHLALSFKYIDHACQSYGFLKDPDKILNKCYINVIENCVDGQLHLILWNNHHENSDIKHGFWFIRLRYDK